jgi:cation diffusion facilitator CzcD-associated flavoprotein CzcO
LAAEVHQLHSSDYHRPDDIADGPVLVVGGGNTGFQIAHELAAPTTSTWQSAHDRHRSRSGYSGATCSRS